MTNDNTAEYRSNALKGHKHTAQGNALRNSANVSQRPVGAEAKESIKYRVRSKETQYLLTTLYFLLAT
jgi:hypothetical protein